MQTAALRELIARQRPGWALERDFYTSDEFYEFERGWLATQWYVLAHASEVREPGSFIVRDLLCEPLVIARDSKGDLRGFYNVCRHRGSRICDRDGRSSSLVCPYHGWTYRLDGGLRAATALPEGTDMSQLGLRTVPVREMGGIVLGSLKGDLQTVDQVQHELEPGLNYHGIPEARIAARRSYATNANWKLVMENFFECYHCLPAHPEYCRVMRFVDSNTADGAVAWRRAVEIWFKDQADPNSPLKFSPLEMDRSAIGLLTPESPLYTRRGPIGDGRKTESEDGRPVAPLMGQQTHFDGGISSFDFQPFIVLNAFNDHAVMFQFLPTGPESTDVILTWLVNPAASDTEVDVQRMTWLWDVTMQEDKTIVERNAAGVRSLSYTPGPYSLLERGPVALINRYLRDLSAAVVHRGPN